jgi:hypothetical protein
VSTPSSLDREVPLADDCGSPRTESSLILDREVPPLVRIAQAAFLRDLPQLIREHRRSWVAYHGEERVAIGSSKRRLFKECAARKLRPGEFVVRLVELEMPQEIAWNESRDV